MINKTLYLLITFFCLICNIKANNNFIFKHYTVSHGLSNSNINDIAQDSLGFIWIATDNGLNKFDGYTFTSFYSSDDNSELKNDEIRDLYVDKDGIIWIGSFRGLFTYNPYSGQFTKIDVILNNEDLVNKPIFSLVEDADGVIWIGTSGNGLICYNKKNGKINSYTTHSPGNTKLCNDFILYLYIDKKGILWIGTEHGGFDLYNKNTNTFTNVNPLKQYPNHVGSNSVISFCETNNGNILVGTRGEGLFEFDTKDNSLNIIKLKNNGSILPAPKEIYCLTNDKKGRTWFSSSGNGVYYFSGTTNTVTRLHHSGNNDNSIINDNIRTIFEDRQSNIWIVSYQGGINVIPNTHTPFKTYDFYNPNALNFNNSVSAIIQDNNENLWVGFDGDGIKIIDKTRTQIKHYLPGMPNAPFVNDKAIISFMLDKNNNMWIGSYLEGITVYNLDTKRIRKYKSSAKPNSISNDYITTILQDSRNNIWIGTNGGGLNLYNPKTDGFLKYSQRDSSTTNRPVNDWIITLMEDNNNRIWIGTFWGLSIFDPITGQFINYINEYNLPGNISNNVIYSLYESSKNEIWIGTREGLNKFIPEKNSFISYNISDGLPGNMVFAIHEDNNATLWLSTNRGLCNFNPVTLQTTNYYQSDGLQSNEFNRNASYKAKNGELFFGGVDGLSFFNPDSLNFNYDIPKPVITQFRIFNSNINPNIPYGNRVVLSKPVAICDTIIIKEKDKLITFDIAALDFSLPEKTNYRCMLEGFETDWRQFDYKQRRVTYTNLDAGTYNFKIKASSINNKWDNNYKSIILIVEPPFYKTWWAFAIYYVIILTTIYGLWQFLMHRLRLKNQIRIERIEHEKENELNQTKLRFFTNISHDFRTPITLIVGPLEKMIDDRALPKKYRETFGLMLKNANRLLRMVNQIMDIRKIESGNMKVKAEKADLIPFLADIYNSFKQYAEQKKINLFFETSEQSLVCWFDPDKVDKIVFNLLSNAFKFTQANGSINLICRVIGAGTNKNVSIIVKDTGIGIPTSEHDKIFQRFYQTTHANHSHSLGSGVGLSLSKSLAEIHHGNLTFESQEHTGTTFELTIPINEDAYTETEKITPETTGVEKYMHLSPETVLDPQNIIDQTADNNPNKATILIVEDNYDLRQYIKNELISLYSILEAENGKIGFQIAVETMPDLVISDVMMPEMDGLELCSMLKSNIITNHIPVILLTAKVNIEHRIAGIERGADSYIPKPFHPDHLKIRAQKLLELRNTLKAKYSGQVNLAESPIPVINEEDKYLSEITNYILSHLDQSDLNIEILCKDLGISRANLYRKIKLLTGKSPTEFVRIIRLNEAARLLLNNEKTISEVCYAVGFNSPSYFSISFKDHFSITPTEYVKRVENG